ncbi:histidine triad nucleotide-binding protein [endosymbiont of Pachyrhynchus infernalis]|uniref:histidine triad nucleotide-binding protein n=1 Tax=endosymbiont of Pachyrhynchus infernalis TaxID=1971488 RepID=UPI000DC71166|nr:histidine triad nucleotide-binding protein [endosymbiont of Pachyrhynchus infernalis]BBA84891.1 putative nucleotide-binding protein [endosymbiont of Pachyrhynchus infernalis]
MYDINNIFYKIINGHIKSDIIYKDKIVTAFYDINPKALIHILIVTNKLISTLNDINIKDKYIIGHLIYISTKIAKMKGMSDNGYRLIINCNNYGGQEINHLHVHLLGGEKLKNL